ncbi:MAG: hypothetical protein PXX73_03535 [Sideroxydans sp.]|nr:hypothetical protein [Sideroxydans sp.]
MTNLARTAFIFSVCLSASASAAELGRLFFSPEQRAEFAFDQLQSNTGNANSNTLKVNGIVQQQGGRRTAWVNGVAQQMGNSSDTPERVAIPVPGQAAPVNVKVGQQISIKPTR